MFSFYNVVRIIYNRNLLLIIIYITIKCLCYTISYISGSAVEVIQGNMESTFSEFETYGIHFLGFDYMLRAWNSHCYQTKEQR